MLFGQNVGMKCFKTQRVSLVGTMSVLLLGASCAHTQQTELADERMQRTVAASDEDTRNCGEAYQQTIDLMEKAEKNFARRCQVDNPSYTGDVAPAQVDLFTQLQLQGLLGQVLHQNAGAHWFHEAEYWYQTVKPEQLNLGKFYCGTLGANESKAIPFVEPHLGKTYSRTWNLLTPREQLRRKQGLIVHAQASDCARDPTFAMTLVELKRNFNLICLKTPRAAWVQVEKVPAQPARVSIWNWRGTSVGEQYPTFTSTRRVDSPSCAPIE